MYVSFFLSIKDKEYMRTMQAAIDATVAAGVPPDDVDRTDVRV